MYTIIKLIMMMIDFDILNQIRGTTTLVPILTSTKLHYKSFITSKTSQLATGTGITPLNLMIQHLIFSFIIPSKDHYYNI